MFEVNPMNIYFHKNTQKTVWWNWWMKQWLNRQIAISGSTSNSRSAGEITITGMRVVCDEVNWKYFAGGYPQENFETKKDIYGAFGCIFINYKNNYKK